MQVILSLTQDVRCFKFQPHDHLRRNLANTAILTVRSEAQSVFSRAYSVQFSSGLSNIQIDWWYSTFCSSGSRFFCVLDHATTRITIAAARSAQCYCDSFKILLFPSWITYVLPGIVPHRINRQPCFINWRASCRLRKLIYRAPCHISTCITIAVAWPSLMQ